MLNQQQQKSGAIYLRLSRDDGGDAESNSINNQRDMLKQYAKDKGIIIKHEYVDDGVSGVTFDRRGFGKLIEDIEAGRVGTLLVKDLSRLGRNNALVAYYTEIVFQDYGVRFICVNDGFDSSSGDNEIMGFKSVINEFYARDISKKIRSSFKTMALKGKFTGSVPPYGYSLDPDDKHRFVVNPETAPIVKEIFAMSARGMKTSQIVTHLSDSGILTPRAYFEKVNGWFQNRKYKEYPTEWHYTTVFGILKNRQYCGHLVSQKTTTQSFKNKKIVFKPEDEWIIYRDTHEALVDEQTFEFVQSLIKTKKRENKAQVDNIYAGLLKCSTCGYNLCYASPTGREKTGAYYCNIYKQRSRIKACTSHYISSRLLTSLVFNRFQKVSELAKEYKDNYEEFYNNCILNGADLNLRFQRQELEKLQRRICELDSILKKIVEQNALGALTDERFASLSAEYENEQQGLFKKAEQMTKAMTRKRYSLQNTEFFLNAIGKYENAAELTAPMLHELIEKIVVYQSEGKGKSRTQEVEIHWRYIGLLPD